MKLIKLLFRSIFCAVALSGIFQTVAANSTLAEDPENVIKLIRDGLREQPAHPSGGATLLIGLTGSGKTTLAKFITGDNSRLISVAATGQAQAIVCPTRDPMAAVSDYDDDYSFKCENEEVAKEYYIKDLDDEKIGNDITISKTFYPEIITNKTTGDVMVDCPGFADTRSESYEIAIAVFMKNVFKWAKQAKILVVVNYSAVLRTGDRNELRTLLRFVTTLLKNYQVFNTSVGLVVTKVTNEYNRQHKVIGDEPMIEQIAGFLRSVRTELEQHDPDDPKIQVLSTFLTRIGSRYPHIGIFRRSYAEGPLLNMPNIQIGKHKIHKMLTRNLHYANFTDSDIGFAIRSGSEALVIKLCKIIMTDIDSLLQRLRVEFTEYYVNVVSKLQNYDQLSVQLRKEIGFFKLFSLDQSGPLEVQLDWFVDIMVANSETLYLSVKSTVQSIKNQATYLDLLKDLTSDPEAKPKDGWKAEVKSLIQYVDELAEWYEFLMFTFARLAQNDFQSTKNTLSFNTLKHWPLFKQHVFNDPKWPTHPHIERKIALANHEQKSLEDVLHVLLDPVDGRLLDTNPDICELQIEGHFVRTSDVTRFIPKCGRRTLATVNLFAQYTVFIDSSISAVGSETLFGIVAPKWEVIGNHHITLSGYAGQNQDQSTTGNGEAGFPGGPSGTFFGVGLDFINVASLKIFINGGDGGNGQMGKNGEDGHGDVEPDLVHNRACTNDHYSSNCRQRTKYIDIGRIKYKMDQVKCGRVNAWSCPDYDVEFSIDDGPGPTRGFHGGQQGLGGKRSTNSQIIDLRGNTAANLHSYDGSLGPVGRGGIGGLGSIKNGVYRTDIITSCNFWGLTGIAECRRFPLRPGFRSQSAADGLSNVSGIQATPRPVKDFKTYTIINKYRQFIVNQWSHNQCWINNADLEFVESISANSKIKNLPNPYPLTTTFLSLEENLKRRRANQ